MKHTGQLALGIFLLAAPPGRSREIEIVDGAGRSPEDVTLTVVGDVWGKPPVDLVVHAIDDGILPDGPVISWPRSVGWIEAPGYAPEFMPWGDRIVLRPAFEIKGQVLLPDGKPVAEATVRYREIGSNSYSPIYHHTLSRIKGCVVQTDGDGWFSLRGVTISRRCVGIVHLNFEVGDHRYCATAGIDIAHDDGAEVTLDPIILSRGRGVDGIVVDSATSDPIADAVAVGDWDQIGPPPEFQASSDETGRFVLRHLPGNRRLAVELWAKGYGSCLFKEAVVDGWANPMTFRLRRLVQVVCTVIDDGTGGDPAFPIELDYAGSVDADLSGRQFYKDIADYDPGARTWTLPVGQNLINASAAQSNCRSPYLEEFMVGVEEGAPLAIRLKRKKGVLFHLANAGEGAKRGSLRVSVDGVQIGIGQALGHGWRFVPIPDWGATITAQVAYYENDGVRLSPNPAIRLTAREDLPWPVEIK